MKKADKKKDIVEYVYSSMDGISKSDIELVCNIFFDKLSENLANNNRIEIRGIGSFSIRERLVPSDPRFNKDNFDKINCKSVYYRMSKNLSDLLN